MLFMLAPPLCEPTGYAMLQLFHDKPLRSREDVFFFPAHISIALDTITAIG